MAVIKHISSIKASPLALLKYVVGETKEKKAELVKGLNCSEDSYSAYLEMALCYDSYSGQKFSQRAAGSGKQKIKMHHYVMSFRKGEVTPEEALYVGEEWARNVFGYSMQILMGTHTDTDHIHVHFAVNAYDMKGRHWIDNQKTLKECRDISDKLMRKYGLHVIKEPKRSGSITYTEWLARKNNTSWKQKLCDDIDRIVLMENVKNIADLADQLISCGYEIRQGKYLSVKPAELKRCRAVRSFRLGDGYGLEELQYRIDNKNQEMSLDKILTYSGVQREYAICLRQMQISFYRCPEFCHSVTYSELRRTAELLCYVHENKIHTKQAFEDHVNRIAEKADAAADRCNEITKRIKEKEFILEHGERYLELIHTQGGLMPKNISELASLRLLKDNNICSQEDLYKVSHDLELLKSELSQRQSEYEQAVADKKTVTAHYTTFIRQLETDYAHYCKTGKKELEEYEASLPKPEPVLDKEFVEACENIPQWAEKVNAKAAEKKRIREEQEKTARRNRDSNSR